MAYRTLTFISIACLLGLGFVLAALTAGQRGSSQTQQEANAASEKARDNVAEILSQGQAALKTGHLAEAVGLLTPLLDQLEGRYGGESLEWSRAANQLALALYYIGDYAAARPLLDRALAINEQQLGPEHTDTATSLNNLAGLLDAVGEYALAKPLYERALAINENHFGPAHTATATSLNNLAMLLQAMGDYAEAKPLLERALAIREEQLGPEHTDTATSLNNLAGLLLRMGDYAEAKPLLERALATSEEQLGPGHPTTATSLNNLAWLLKAMGDYAEAKPLLERALAITEEQLGPDHPATAMSLQNLGWWAVEAGGEKEHERARAQFARAARIYESAGARGDLWGPLAGGGTLAVLEERWSEGAALYRQAIDAIEAVRGTLDTEKTQTSFMRDKIWVYKNLEELLHKLHENSPEAGHDREMFKVAERGRARAFLDLLGEARTRLRLKAPDDWKTSYTEALGELNGVQKILSQANIREAERQAQHDRLAAAEAELERLEAALRRDNPLLASLQAPVY